ncbi:hypothetical protein J3R30DRAFT_3483577 [Lentinula aciculospora]|uniref:Secreted protein n=1 Tax=Lentinula aciculospora TaxID=153920 RepID=A0A9W9AA17_9AGAR|nr:hypothetical protein J3R30DRAFT_3483577 [Lentinula aciculospora]
MLPFLTTMILNSLYFPSCCGQKSAYHLQPQLNGQSKYFICQICQSEQILCSCSYALKKMFRFPILPIRTFPSHFSQSANSNPIFTPEVTSRYPVFSGKSQATNWD